MVGYWNQMADELYPDFDAGLSDFKDTEGERAFRSLKLELLTMYSTGRFPPLSEIKAPHSDSFWKRFDRVVTADQIEKSGLLSGGEYDAR